MKTALTQKVNEREKRLTANSGFKKLAVQWLIEHSCIVSNVVLADNFVLRNRQLLKPAKRQDVKKPVFENFGGRNSFVTVTIYDLGRF